MKHLFLFALLLCASFCPLNSSAMSNLETPDYIITDDIICLVSPVEYMNADYVTIELLDSHGNVQASASVLPGTNVTFMLNSDSRKVVSTFHVGITDYIIQEDTVD